MDEIDRREHGVLGEHPDLLRINDWFLNGPRNGRIEEAVRDLTLVHGLRLVEVEGIILQALEAKRRDILTTGVQP